MILQNISFRFDPTSIFSNPQCTANFCISTPSLLCFSCFVLLIFKLIESRNKSICQFPLPPGPNPWPIAGNLPEMLMNKPAYRWIHKFMQEMGTDIACIRLGNVHVIPVTCPEIARQFLRKHDADFASRPLCMSGEVISGGYSTVIFQPFEDRWKVLTNAMRSHLLSPEKHKWFTTKRVEEADHLIRYVYNQCIGSSNKTGLVNIRTAARHYCMNVIMNMVFSRRYFGEGKEDGGPGAAEKEHANSIFRILALAYPLCVSDYVPWLRKFKLDGVEKMLREAFDIIGKYHDPLIEERIQQWKDGNREGTHDWLDIMINLKDGEGNQLFSLTQIKAQIIEFMIATVDNPSNALEWTLAEMLNQPHILEKAVEELDRVVGRDRLVQESDLPKLNYIKACAREAFRLHPIAPFVPPHVSIKDKVISGYFIPKGSRVLLSRLGLGRNPNVWEEPLKFKPERHLNGDTVELTEPDLRFISFSTGRRGCRGVTLGTSITLMLFARLLQGFSWSLSSNQLKIDFTNSDELLLMSKPLMAMAKPRLPEDLYPKN